MKRVFRIFATSFIAFVLMLCAMAIYYTETPHKSVHAQPLSEPQPTAVYDCNSFNWSDQICRAYDPETKHHFIVILGSNGPAIAPDDY